MTGLGTLQKAPNPGSAAHSDGQPGRSQLLCALTDDLIQELNSNVAARSSRPGSNA